MITAYEGTVRHRRFAVRGHEFSHRISMAYLELDEAQAEPVRELVRRTTGSAPAGPIHLLTLPRRLGKRFNPVNFLYCFSGERLDAVVAEVTNTPWGERHAYVLERTNGRRVLRGEFGKRMHVSPYMGMEQTYVLRAAEPGDTLSVHIENFEAGEVVFDATLSLKRVGARRRVTSPWRVLALIYGHAIVLRLKRVPWHSKPAVPA
jgi:DUF1365 family protein